MKYPSIIPLFAVAALFAATSARATVIFEHVGDTDPLTELFTGGPLGSSSASADVGPPPNWRILSPSGSGGSYNYNTTAPFEAALIDPTGWTFTMTAKMSGANSVYESSIRIKDALNRMEMHLIDGSGALAAGVYYTNPVGVIDAGSLISPLDPSSGFRTYQMIKNPLGAGTADDEVSFYVDGVHALTLLQSSMYGAGGDAQHFFGPGTAASGTTVDQQYALVRFETGQHVVPEPSALALLGLGMAALIGAKRRRT